MKQIALDLARESKKEGVVFKKLEAAYMPGRTGTNLKLKFWKTATLRVCKKKKEDGHASFAVEAFQILDPAPDRKPIWVAVGNVSAKSSEIPETGTFVEIKYLYLGVGNRLYQPEFLHIRTDVTDADCDYGQLVPKGEAN